MAAIWNESKINEVNSKIKKIEEIIDSDSIFTGVWAFNTEVRPMHNQGDYIFNLTFENNGKTYHSIKLSIGASSVILYYDDNIVYNNKWQNDVYKKIKITDASQVKEHPKKDQLGLLLKDEAVRVSSDFDRKFLHLFVHCEKAGEVVYAILIDETPSYNSLQHFFSIRFDQGYITNIYFPAWGKNEGEDIIAVQNEDDSYTGFENANSHLQTNDFSHYIFSTCVNVKLNNMNFGWY